MAAASKVAQQTTISKIKEEDRSLSLKLMKDIFLELGRKRSRGAAASKEKVSMA
jgi:hypothetical protein